MFTDLIFDSSFKFPGIEQAFKMVIDFRGMDKAYTHKKKCFQSVMEYINVEYK